MTTNDDSSFKQSSDFLPVPTFKRLDPKNDVVFQALFGDPRMKPSLIGLLTAVIKPSTPIMDLEFLNTKLAKNRIEHRGSVVDVMVRLQDGTKVDVEMQMRGKGSLRSRALYYWGKIYSGSLQVAEEYHKLKPTIVVIFLNEIEFLADETQYHHVFLATCRTNSNLILKGFRIDFIELPRMPLLPGATNADTALADWSQFLLNPGSKNLEGVYMNNKNIKDALDRLTELSKDPEIVEAARQREMSGVLLATSLAEAEEIGLEKGKEIGFEQGKVMGREETKKQILLNFQKSGLAIGMSLQQIAEITGIDVEEVKKILAEIKTP